MAKLAATQDQLYQQTAAVDQPSEQQRRQRQWAPRTRTGCLGCRVRRVKCDEGRPKCKSCAKRNMTCRYELNPATGLLYGATNLDPAASRLQTEKLHTLDRWQTDHGSALEAVIEAWLPYDMSRGELQEKRWRLKQVLEAQPGPWYSEFAGVGPVPMWLIPAGWEALEAAEWRNRFINRVRVEEDLAESSYRFRSQTEPYHPNNDIRVAGILCLRIFRIAEIEGTEPQPTRSTMHLWIRLRELLSSTIKKLNPEITDTETVVRNTVLRKICDLSVIEVYLNLGGARAHFRGFLSILRCCGTPIELARKELQLGVAIHIMTASAILSNTVMTRDANLREIYAFSDQELLNIYCLSHWNSFPCPSFLWAQILKITRLRRTTVPGSGGGHVKQEIRRIFRQIASFAPESWQEPYAIPEGHVALFLASMFKAAVSIYCCASISVSVTDQEYAAWSLPIIHSQRSLLFGLLDERLEFGEKVRDATIWPLAVAGYAAGKGTYSERTLILRILGETSDHAACSLLRQLNKFWLYPGEGRWDDCWGDVFVFPL